MSAAPLSRAQAACEVDVSFIKLSPRVVGFSLSMGLLGAACTEDTPEVPFQGVSNDAGSAPGYDAGLSSDASFSVTPDAATDAALLLGDAPTWHQDIAPLVSEKCSGCHEEGGIAPFSVKSYATAKPFATLMAFAVEEGRMPPFLAQETDGCKPKHGWQNDLRLTAAQKKLLRDWATAGAPEGDASKAATIKPPAPIKLEREDVVMTLPKEVTVEGKKDLHMCVIVDPKLTKDEYVIGRLITSGNAKILHHVVSYVIAPGDVNDLLIFPRKQTKAELIAAIKAEKGVGPGESYDCFGGPALTTVSTQMLDAWAPGGIPNMAPPEAGQPVSKDSLVLLDIHYHPIGAPEKDSKTKLSLMLGKEKPKFVARTLLLGNFEKPVTFGDALTGGGDGDLLLQPGETTKEFKIPANAEGHIEDMTWKWKLPAGIRVIGMATHMHYVGRKMRITLEHATPVAGEDKEQCLIETPSWDFNWQRGYAYDAPYDKLPEMRSGDTLKFHCEFDNSMKNKFVVKALADQNLTAPKDVVLGEDTLDEMCLGAIGLMYPNP